MAVALRARTPLVWEPANPPVWPAGTSAGDVALVWNVNPGRGGPTQSGWNYLTHDTWWRRLSAADVAAGPGVWAARMIGIVTVTGCRGVGRVSTQRGVQVTEPGGAVLVEGWTGYHSSATGLGSGGDPTRLDSIRAYRAQWCAWWLRTAVSAGFVQVERDGDAWGYRAFELLPYMAPASPSVVRPSGDVPNTLPVVLQWVHRSADRLPQEAFRVRAKLSSSGTWQYVTADGQLSASVQTVASSAMSVSVPAGVLSDGGWDWGVQTQDSGLWSDWSATATITVRTPPTVGVPTLMQGAAGEPWLEVGWPDRATPGSTQTAWEVVVAPAGAGVAGSVWQSQTVASTAASMYTPPLPQLVSGGVYNAWVRIQQAGGLWSDWASSGDVTVTYTTPAAPASVTAVDGAPLAVTVTGIVAAADVVVVEASTDGVEWQQIAADPLPNTTHTVLVPLAPYGAPMWWRAMVWKTVTTTLGESVRLPSGWTSSGSAAASTDRGAYLVDPATGDWLPVALVAGGASGVTQAVHTSFGLGADRARTDRTPPAGQRGTVVAHTDTVADRDRLVDWLTGRPKWWLRWPPETSIDTMQPVAEPPVLMALDDPVGLRRWATHYQTREIMWGWVEVK